MGKRRILLKSLARALLAGACERLFLRFELTKNIFHSSSCPVLAILLEVFQSDLTFGFGFAAALSFEEKGEDFVVLAVATGLVAIHDFEGAGLLAEAGVGDLSKGVGVGGERGFVLLFGALAQLVADGGALHAGESHLPPFGDENGFDEGDFIGGLGAEGGFELGQEILEDFAGLAFQKDDFGDHAVAEVVANGKGFAFGGDGTMGPGAVAAGGGSVGFGAEFGAGRLAGKLVLMVHTTQVSALGRWSPRLFRRVRSICSMS
jgi:hypothetical protein